MAYGLNSLSVLAHYQGLYLFVVRAEMDRGRKAMPIQNKQCHERYVKHCQSMHRAKVRETRGG